MMYLLPGIGTDVGMYSQEWRSMPNVRLIDWRGCEDSVSLPSAARRLIDRFSIRDGSVVLGTSLGGMVACEISKVVDLKHLILVSSAVCKEEINAFLSFIHPLVDVTPIKLVQQVVSKYPSDLAKMFGKSNAQFTRSMCKAIFSWNGLGDNDISPIRIHGLHDKVIPLPSAVDCTIDGGHCITMTHATDCIQFLKARINPCRIPS